MQELPKIILIVIACAAGWVILMNLVAMLTGWKMLAEFYREQWPYSGEKFRGQRASLRWGMGYNGVLTIGANTEGLHASVFPPFQFGHAPLFIPWEEISATTKRVWRINIVLLQFSRCPSVPFCISRHLADRLEQASGFKLNAEQDTQK